MTIKPPGELGRGKDIGHAKEERHPFFLPLFDWGSKIFNPAIAGPLEYLLSRMSILWSRAEFDKKQGRPVDQGVEEFIACLEQVSQLESNCLPENEDFKHLNNIKVALKDVLLPQLEKMQKLV